MRVWGTVSFQGKLVNEGLIVFIPIEETAGPSTGTAIEEGRYEIAARSGPCARGVYRVEITASGPEKTYSPNASGAGPMVTVREQFIPLAFNQKSTLLVAISADPAQNQHDFDLK